MKTTQDIDQLFNMMNDSLSEDLSIPEVNLQELDNQFQDEKLKEHRSVTLRLIIMGILLIPVFIFTKEIQTKINILLFVPILMRIFWINHQGMQALKNQDKAVSFTEFEEKKNQIREIFHNQFKRMRTPIYLALLTGASVNFYFIMKAPNMFDIVGHAVLTPFGCFITIKAVRGLIHKYK